jgi:hypothetical protein
VALNPNDTPKLIDEDKPTAAVPGHTLYLKIDLEIDPLKGQPVQPMTAVYAPDPNQITGGKANVLLWFQGDKKVWSKHRKGTLDASGQSARDYLQLRECKLREFVQKSKNKNFLLVVPTLGDKAGTGPVRGDPKWPRKAAGGLLWDQGNAEAFLKQVLNGVTAYLNKAVKDTASVVLAAHSGGGHIASRMAEHFTGPFDKTNEVWCFDCTYWGGGPLITWAKKGHSDPRLFVYSTGGVGNGSTGDSANAVRDFAHTRDATGKGVEVWIDNYPTVKTSPSTMGFFATYGGSAGGHYESIETYLPQLVGRSQNLK